jgi:hypothetical protein
MPSEYINPQHKNNTHTRLNLANTGRAEKSRVIPNKNPQIKHPYPKRISENSPNIDRASSFNASCSQSGVSEKVAVDSTMEQWILPAAKREDGTCIFYFKLLILRSRK